MATVNLASHNTFGQQTRHWRYEIHHGHHSRNKERENDGHPRKILHIQGNKAK
jgi:hypothetical protein